MSNTDRPRGRDPVRAALIEAGSRLFAEQGPRGVSVREVAQAAGVNHGLVHRHFGSKDGLLAAVMQHLSAQVAASLTDQGEQESLSDVLRSSLGSSDQIQHLRILAHSLLEGHGAYELQEEFPVVQRMLEAARRGTASSLRPESLVSLLLSVWLGMQLFDPYLKASTGQSDKEWEETRRELGRFALKWTEFPKD